MKKLIALFLNIFLCVLLIQPNTVFADNGYTITVPSVIDINTSQNITYTVTNGYTLNVSVSSAYGNQLKNGSFAVGYLSNASAWDNLSGSGTFTYKATLGNDTPLVAGNYSDTLTFTATTNIDVAKGDIIKLNGDERYYRIIKDYGDNTYRLLQLSGRENVRYNYTNSSYYSGSNLDNYLNSTYYNALPEQIRNAIVDQQITQRTFERYKTTATSSAYLIGDWYWLRQTATTNVGSRHIFQFSADDMIEYAGSKNVSSEDMSWMLYACSYSTLQTITNWSLLTPWVMDRDLNSSEPTVYSYKDGYVWNSIRNGSNDGISGRTVYEWKEAAVFVIDLSKVPFEKYDTGTITVSVLGY